MVNKKYSKTEAKVEVKKLVEQFHTDFGDTINPHMKEAQLEDKYIKPFFSFLNWNIHNEGLKKGVEEFRVQTSQKIKKSTKQPDYELWLPAKDNPDQMKRHLFMEAKDPKYDLQKEVKWMRQAYQYAHSTLSLSELSNRRTNLSILTDFEEFRLFDCSDPFPLTKSDPSLYNKYVIKQFDLRYTDYLNKFDLIWDTFERDHVQNGSLSEYEITDKILKKNRKAPDLRFLDDLKQWRLDFARSMYKSNKTVSNTLLTTASQVMVNRIIFLKMLTDREIEDDYLTKIIEKININPEKISIYDSCRDVFQELDQKYNGDIFTRRDELDHVKVENIVFKKIIQSLQPEKSIYTLAAMPVEIIGNAYEQFLGDIIVHKGRGISSEPKPEVRKAGGVYYTPKYIVDYIVKNTVGGKLKKCNNPQDVEEIKIVDPACGSGSFLLGAYDILIEWHLNYFKSQVDKMLKNRKTESEINRKLKNEIKCYLLNADDMSSKYILHLTSKLKKQILLNNIFGVDIDNNAVEITKFSLSMKALENTTHEELYEDLDLFHQTLLPELNNNIKCGNSLIGSDYFDGKMEFLITDEERNKVNAFDWDAEFPEVFAKDGFDCVIGNPPYVRQEILGQEFKNYAKQKYKTFAGTADLYTYFIERGVSVLNKGGLFSYIVANKWMRSNYGKPLRVWLKNQSIIKIVDFGEQKVFKEATTYPCIVIIDKSSSKNKFKVSNIKTLEFSDLTDYVKKNNIIVSKDYLADDGWFLVDEKKNQLFIKIQKGNIQLIEYVKRKINRGILTGYNKAFIIDQNIRSQLIKEDKNSEEIIKPFLVGKDVKRYDYPKIEKYLIFTRRGINIKKYPVINDYLFQFKKNLMPKPLNWSGGTWAGRKPGNYKWYEIQDSTEYYKEFEKSKIIFPSITKRANYTFDTDSVYSNDKTSIITTGDKYLLGMLNSQLLDFYIQNIASTKQGGYFEYKPMYVGQLPIREIDFENKKDKASHDRMAAYVDKMLELNKKLPKVKTEHEKTVIQRQIDATDQKIDKLVYELYGLTEEEVKIVEESVG